MNNRKAKIITNTCIARNIWKMVVSCDTSDIERPGRFVNIRIDEHFLRRPISICDFDDETMTLIYKVVGEGTKWLSQQTEWELDMLMPLGNGYDIDAIPDNPVIIGGGVGVPPMYGLAKRIADKNPKVLLGFSFEEEVFYEEEFRSLGLEVEKMVGGYITDILEDGKYVLACGPEVMLKAIDAKSAGGQYSFEARMACGFGACMGCSCRTKYGYKRICKDGPVLSKEEIVW